VNGALARLAGVFAVALFVWLLAADDFGREPVLVRAEEYCTVGGGPRQTRSRYVSQLLKRLARGDLEAHDPLRGQRGFEERIAAAVAPVFSRSIGAWVLADSGAPGRAVIHRALESSDEDMVHAGAAALALVSEPTAADFKVIFDHLQRDSPDSWLFGNGLEFWGGAGAVPEFLRLVEQGRPGLDDRTIPQLSLEQIARHIGIDAAEPLARLFIRTKGEARNRALYCTDALYEDAEPAVPILLAELERCSADEQRAIFEIVAGTGAPLDAAAQVAFLRDLAADPTDYEYLLLARCSDRKEAALRALRGDDSIEATFALHALKGPSPALRARWREGLRSDRSETVSQTLYGLARIGADIEPMLADVAAVVSRNGFWSEAMAAGGAAAVPHLMPLLRSENADVRGEAMVVLDRIGHAGRAAAPALVSLVRSGDRKAYYTLTLVDPENAVALELLTDETKTEEIRSWYCAILYVVLGPSGRAAGPALRKRLRTMPPGAGFTLGMALGALGEADAATVSRFAGQLGSSDRVRRTRAARVLFAIGRDAAPALAQLGRACNDCSPRTALWATLAADAANGEVTRTLALLADPARSLDTVWALSNASLGDGARLDSRLVPGMVRLARTQGAKQDMAIYCLRGIEATDPSAVAALRAILDDDRLPASARKLARESLAHIE